MNNSNNPNASTAYPQQSNFQFPPGFYSNKAPQKRAQNIIAFSNQPQFYSEERNLKYQFPAQNSKQTEYLDPNHNTNSNFKAEGIPNIYKASPENVIEHLDLDNFKAKPCPINYTHNHKHCPFYHNSKDRKRVGNFYISELCEFHDNCPKGDNCLKSHNRVEQLYRREKYKTKFCSFYPGNLDKCDYGIYCSFAHSENDIIVELIHNYEYDKDFFMFIFKTAWCPFNLIPHDRGLCVYAHNYQDYRRKPGVCSYDPTPCPFWKTSEFLNNYEDACPNNYSCDKSHGWKESEFHPLNYKTRPCPNGGKCPKNLDCPYYHNPQDQRIIGQQIHCKIFRYHPKNRIVTNTFKITNPQGINFQNSNQLMEERRNSMSNLQALMNQDMEANTNNFYPTEIDPNYYIHRNNSVPLFKHNSSNNILLTKQQEEYFNLNQNPNANGLMHNMGQQLPQQGNAMNFNNAYPGNSGSTFLKKPFNMTSSQPNQNANPFPNQMPSFNAPPQLSKKPQRTNLMNNNSAKRQNENPGKNPTHFQMKSNLNFHENFLNLSLNNNNDSFKDNENFQSEKKNKNAEENDLQNIDSSEIKGEDRLRKMVLLENNNNEELKEKSLTSNKYDPESSYDEHNENILKEICEEDHK